MSEWKEEDYWEMNKWLQRHRITEVECLIPDLTGIARGKIMPAEKLLRKEGSSAGEPFSKDGHR